MTSSPGRSAARSSSRSGALQSRGPGYLLVEETGVPVLRSGMKNAASRPGHGSAFHERLFDHEMAGLAVAAFEEAARLEHAAQFFQHGGAAAHHDAVGREVQRRQADVVEQLFGGDEVGDAAAI